MSPQQLAAWEKLQTVTEILRREVGRDLWSDAQLSDAEFTVLAHLQSAGTAGVRPTDCARTIGWDSSRLSHQLRRLQKRGFVAKSPGGGDGRAVLISATPAGTAAYRRAIGPHLRAAQRWFADALTPDALAGLSSALDALLDHARRTERAVDAGVADS
jgi:DNA-binding MarR family transcriptional regulator